MWLRVFFCLCLTGPALAEPLAGADDPAFRAALAAVTEADTPDARQALRAQAEAGNAAAQVALPVVEAWWPYDGLLQDRQALRKIGGHWTSDLASAASGAQALWQGGAISPLMPDQVNRALGLYKLGEDRRGDALLEAWVNHMPDAAALPEGFADLPAAPLLKALILLRHLTAGDAATVPVLQHWLDQDRIEGWMVLAEVTDHYPGSPGPALTQGLGSGPDRAKRLEDGRRAVTLLWRDQAPRPLPAPDVEMVLHDLLPRPQFAPVRAYCAARCPDDPQSCAAAFAGLLGAPRTATTALTPPVAVMETTAFFATPRGEQVLLGSATKHHLGLDHAPDPAAALVKNPAFQAIRQQDACFAAGLERALTRFPQAKQDG